MDNNSYTQYSSIAFQLLASIALCAYLGQKIDLHFQSKTPIYTAIMVIVGIAAGLYLVVKQVRRNNNGKN
jgi:F0F1-type ATP synthase assembly protein I